MAEYHTSFFFFVGCLGRSLNARDSTTELTQIDNHQSDASSSASLFSTRRLAMRLLCLSGRASL